MSIHTIDNYSYYYKIQEPVPAWLKNERYEYCAPAEESRKGKIRAAASFLTMLFHF